MNSRITPKERNLLKGAIRRVFSRSDLRRQIVTLSMIVHTDPNRPRVKKWGICSICKNITPLYKMAVDHIVPIVPVMSSLEQMSWDEVVNNTWCIESNLQSVCEICHSDKTKEENKLRRQYKKEKKNK